MESASFYQNVFLLTQAVQPSREFVKVFREGMFDRPNTVGFLHVSHYLLDIYDSERLKKNTQWPTVCKKTEAKYRNDVKDVLTSVARENLDIDFPQILASHLLHAGGSKVTTIMWKLSVVALRSYIKRQNGEVLFAPKAGEGDDLTRFLLNNTISRNLKEVEEIHETVVKAEKEAEEYAKDIAESIKESQEALLLTRERLIDLSSNAPVHATIKSRLDDPNDIDVIQMWKSSLETASNFVHRKEKRLRIIAELSDNVACMVSSIVSTNTNVLDGSGLPIIDTKTISEIDDLSPETQIMLYHPYAKDGTLVLENFLSLFSLYLGDVMHNIEKNTFPDLPDCELQVAASCEDIKSIHELFHNLHERIAELTSRIKTESNCHERRFHDTQSLSTNDDLFDSVLLKSSPQININLNVEGDRDEILERLELTPVEHVHRALFSRHKRNNEATTPASKSRPKLLVARINFDESSSMSMSEKFSPVNRSATSRTIGQWTTSRGGNYSRLFSAYHNRASNKLTDLQHSHTICDVYDASELRSHLSTSEFNDNRDTLRSALNKETANRASSTLNEEEKFVVPSVRDASEIKSTIAAVVHSPKNQLKADKMSNRRVSISDLVDRWRKVTNKSTVTTRMNFSDDPTSDESQKD